MCYASGRDAPGNLTRLPRASSRRYEFSAIVVGGTPSSLSIRPRAMLGMRQGSLVHQGRANLVEQPPIDMHPLHQIRKLLPSLQDSLISSLSQQSSDHDDIDVLEGGDLFRVPGCVRCLLDRLSTCYSSCGCSFSLTSRCGCLHGTKVRPRSNPVHNADM